MKLVLDASVAVAAMRPDEPAYAASRARIERALQGADQLVQPALFGVEVAGALARRGVTQVDIRALVRLLRAPPHQIVTIGPKASASAETCALHGILRGADAFYVWLASARGLPLCTLDEDMARRGAAFCEVMAP
jgi:predicted nucleic acid-binding protein